MITFIMSPSSRSSEGLALCPALSKQTLLWVEEERLLTFSTHLLLYPPIYSVPSGQPRAELWGWRCQLEPGIPLWWVERYALPQPTFFLLTSVLSLV